MTQSAAENRHSISPDVALIVMASVSTFHVQSATPAASMARRSCRAPHFILLRPGASLVS
jgi:hypothetical protein